MTENLCPIHGKDCPGDDGGFFMDGNHPDDMFGVHLMEKPMTENPKKKGPSVAELRRLVITRAAEYAAATGRAQYLDGYRSGGRDDEKLYRDSVSLWRDADAMADRVQVVLRAFERAVRKASR